MENFEVIELQQERDFSKKINITFAFIRQNFSGLGKSLLYVAGPPILLASILMGSAYGKMLNFTSSMGRRDAMGGPGLNIQELVGSYGFWLEIGVGMIAMLIAFVLTMSVLNNYMFLYGEKRTNQIQVSEVWDRVRETFGLYMSTLVLYVITLLATCAIAALPVAALAFISPPLAVLVGIVMAVGLYYVLITYSLVFVVRPYENIGFFESISRSFMLIRSKWWSTFGLIFITSLIAGMMSYVFMIPYYISTFVSAMHSVESSVFEEPSMASQLLNNIFLTLYLLSSFFLRAITLIAIVFQYFNLVELKEAKGLMSRINSVGQAPPPANTQDEQY